MIFNIISSADKFQQANMSEVIRVLVVDDREEVRESMETFLSLHDDMEVVGEASNGRRAVELARRLKPDVILMDVAMPTEDEKPFDGLDACRQIKCETDAAVIVMTVHADRATRSRAQQAGCNLFIEKGVSPSELLGQIREVSKYHPAC